MKHFIMLISAGILIAGCGLLTSESEGTVTVRVEQNVLSIENATDKDVFRFVIEADLAARTDWIPICNDHNRVAPRSTQRIAFHDTTFLPSHRAIVYWWHKGARYGNSEQYGADSLRAIGVPIP